MQTQATAMSGTTDSFDWLEEHYQQEALWWEQQEAEWRRGSSLVDAECAKSSPSRAAIDRALMLWHSHYTGNEEVIEFDLSGLPTQLTLFSR